MMMENVVLRVDHALFYAVHSNAVLDRVSLYFSNLGLGEGEIATHSSLCDHPETH